MINDLNRVTLMGHLGADASQKNPKAPVTFTLATTDRWTDDAGTRHSRTEWHNIVVFGNRARYAIALKKGDRVYVEGPLRANKYEKVIGDETVKFTNHEILAVQIDRVAAKAEAGAENISDANEDAE